MRTYELITPRAKMDDFEESCCVKSSCGHQTCKTWGKPWEIVWLDNSVFVIPEMSETDENSSTKEQTVIGVNGENRAGSTVETSYRENPEQMKLLPVLCLNNGQVGDTPERARKRAVADPVHKREEGRVNKLMNKENTFTFETQEKEKTLRKEITEPEAKEEIAINDCQAPESKQTLQSAALNGNHHYDSVSQQKPRSAATQNVISNLTRIAPDNRPERSPKGPHEMTDVFVTPEHTNCIREDNANLSRGYNGSKPSESKGYLEEAGQEQFQMHQTPSMDGNRDSLDRSFESASSDGSPWVVLRRPGYEKPFLKRCKNTTENETNGKNEHSGSGMQNGQNEGEASISGELNKGFNRTRQQLSCETEQSNRRREEAATVNPDENRQAEEQLHPLSPSLIDPESSNSFLSSMSPESSKVKRNRSFQAVGRGVAKFFSGKRKYKVDSSEREGSPVSDAEEKSSRSNLDLNDKIKDQKMNISKKTSSNGTKRSEVSPQRGEKNSPRGFSLFSRRKKKDKSVPEASID